MEIHSKSVEDYFYFIVELDETRGTFLVQAVFGKAKKR